ncbi:MAG: tetratricopeptide repeat protein [Proteobacteria bacterium]|nr:tetratricopeptide repeat protein [Pseudomonadota bacterium]
MLRMTLFLFFYMSLSCSSTSDKIKLDLPFPSNDSPHNNFTVKDPRSPENIDLQEVFNWQKYYKQAPNAKEQKALADSLLMIPQNTSDRLRLARNSLGLGRRQEAKKLYETILYDEPEHFDAQLELAHIYLAEGSTDRAFDYLSSIHKTLEKMEKPPIELNFRYRYALSLAYIQNQNRKKGHDILTELLERDPGFIPAYGALAQSYLEQEKLDVAEFIAKRGLDRGPDEPRLLNTLAVVALRKNRLDECKIWLQRALQKNPDYVPSLKR